MSSPRARKGRERWLKAWERSWEFAQGLGGTQFSGAQVWWSVELSKVLGSGWFLCWVLALAEVVAGLGRGRGDWGGHEGVSGELVDVRRWPEKSWHGRAQVAGSVRAW